MTGDQLAWEHDDGVVVVSAGSRDVWSYVHRGGRPHVHPLRTPAGHVLTRDAPPDHPWHHGLWFTIKFVDGDNFWEEEKVRGVLKHTAPPEAVRHDDGTVALTGDIRWIRPDRQTVALRETRTVAHRPGAAPDATVLDLTTTLVASTNVVLDRTEFTTWGGYGGLAFRGRGDLVDSRILLADGTETDRVLGTPGAWLDLSGTVEEPDGPAPVGIAVCSHPTSPRHPVPWYGSTRAATYGDEGWSNFFNAAFLWDGPLTLDAGTPLTFRYRVLAHDGTWDADRVAAEQERYGRDEA
jgi:hypothetical protein